ncbi:MAG: response regulator [Bacteroidota bacterium]|nr:response regulator [Bacteroidota bacterium]
MDIPKARILIVDDEESFRLLLKNLLSEEGFPADVAVDGEAAISKVTSPADGFDIMLLDLRMPGKDGIEVLKFCQEHSIGTDIIVLTGVDDVRIAVDCMKLGASEFMVKPVEAESLLFKIHSIMRAREAEERLRNLETQYTTTLLLDLRTPLSGMLTSIGYFMKGWAGPVTPEQEQLLHYLHDSSEHMQTILDDMIDVTKLEAGTISLAKSPLNMRDLLDSVCRRFEVQARNVGVALKYNGAAPLPPVDADVERIEQVLENLLNNALRFTPKGGTISVSTDTMPSAIEISVADTGCGISEADMPHLFDKYKHVIKKSKEKATGLGLAICKKIVEAHNGKIWAESKPGSGAQFHFTLPV